MRAVGTWQKALGGLRRKLLFCLLPAACLLACSIPNLEPQACIDSRNGVREFYSFHFGNEMLNSPESLKPRERFLTSEFVARIKNEKEGIDPYTTGTEELPKAFRLGECNELAPDRTAFHVLLFWKDDIRSEQRPINVEAVKVGEKWLIDNVTR